MFYYNQNFKTIYARIFKKSQNFLNSNASKLA